MSSKTIVSYTCDICNKSGLVDEDIFTLSWCAYLTCDIDRECAATTHCEKIDLCIKCLRKYMDIIINLPDGKPLQENTAHPYSKLLHNAFLLTKTSFEKEHLSVN